MRHRDAVTLGAVGPALRGLMAVCESNCVAACCGEEAYEIAAAAMQPWIEACGLSEGRRALGELEVLVFEIERISAAGYRGDAWSLVRPETRRAFDDCRRWVAAWHHALRIALDEVEVHASRGRR